MAGGLQVALNKPLALTPPPKSGVLILSPTPTNSYRTPATPTNSYKTLQTTTNPQNLCKLPPPLELVQPQKLARNPYNLY